MGLRWVGALLLPLLLGCHSMVALPRDDASDLLHALRDSYKGKDVEGYLAQLDPKLAETVSSPLQEELSTFASIARTKSHLIDMWPVEGKDDAWDAEALFRVWAVTNEGQYHYEDQVLRLRLVRAGKTTAGTLTQSHPSLRRGRQRQGFHRAGRRGRPRRETRAAHAV